MKLSISQLESVAWAGPGADLNDVVTSLSGTVSADGVSADLGDSSRDLVYTKIAPCRIVDTRGATAGALTSNGGFRHFNVAGTTPSWFTPQGGNPCGVPVGATAVAANITVTGTAGYGWLRAYPYGGTGNASVINYNGTADLANGLVLPICDPFTTSCTYDMTVVADAAGTHVIIDVMGYFQRVNKAQYRTVNVISSNTSSMNLSGCTNYMSVTITAPAPGDIVVTANASIRLSHTFGSGNSEVDWGIGTSPTDCSHTYGTNGAFAYATSASPTGYYFDFATVMLKTTVTTAGTHTFYITGTPYGSGTHTFFYGGMKATFTPS